jgi:spore maturation protein CgeB
VYGGYWHKRAISGAHARGIADVATLRRATSAASVTLCLVRRANRDGHVMRSFEIPACGGCMLADDTPEHQSIFGPEGETVTYFQTAEEMVEKARWLLGHQRARSRLASAAHALVRSGDHSYAQRLRTMLAAESATQR